MLKGGGESCVFYQPHFQMLRSNPPPPPLSFLTKSLNTDTEIIYFVQLLNKLLHRIRAAFET